MLPKNKMFRFNFGDFLLSVISSLLLIGGFWFICIVLQQIGCPFPKVAVSQFSDLAFFSLSNFSFITFLAMIPFQTAEGKLSPGFYARIVNRPWSHFGLYILMVASVICWIVLSFHQKYDLDRMLNTLFIAIIISVCFAILFHRAHTLRYLYHPAIVYENLAQLAKEEGFEELWLDLYECTLKAIAENRLSDALNFSKLMLKIYAKVSKEESIAHLQKDLQSLYERAKDLHPLASQFQKNWPFLGLHVKTKGQESLSFAAAVVKDQHILPLLSNKKGKKKLSASN